MPEDEVIQDFDVQQVACFNNGFGEGDVFSGGGRVTAGVIVREGDGEGVSADGFAEDFGDACRGGVDGTSIEGGLGEDVVFGVQDEETDFFLLEEFHFRLEETRDVFRAVDAGSEDFAFECGAAAELEEGGDGGGFGGAEAVDFAEGGEIR